MAEKEEGGGVAGRPPVYLHVGAPKSGTTYLQTAFWHNRDALRRDGLLYPGRHFLSHTHAALDLQRVDFAGYKDPSVPGAWARLADEVREWDGPALISQELLSPSRPDAVRRAMESLPFAEVHVIYTARDLLRQVPAAWQEDIKNRNVLTFEEFLASVKAAPAERCPLGEGFWRMQDAVDVLRRWGADLPPERVHMVTVPRPGAPRGVLWERFCSVVGLAPGAYDTSTAPANTSLGIVEANLIRRLNLALGDDVRQPVYNSSVTGLIGIDTLAHRTDSISIEIPEHDRHWLQARAQEQVEGLRAAGYDVVGDLHELLPLVPPAEVATRPATESVTGTVPGSGSIGPVRVRNPDQVTDAEMLPAAIDCMVALVGGLQRRQDQIEELAAERDRLLARNDRLQDELSDLEKLRDVCSKPFLKRFAHRLADRNRLAKAVLVGYWRIAGRLTRRPHAASR